MEKLSLGSFSIVGRLSEGPLGVLYEGTHGTTHDRVVVRVFPAALTRDPGALSRLQALQRALSRLEPERSVAVQRPSGRDPAIPTVIECGRLPDGALYIATEFVAGESLAVGLRRHSGLPLPNKALRLGRQLSACLAVAHSSGIRHLGLRPDKVLLAHVAGSGDADHVRVLDLGLYDALGYRPRPGDLPPQEQSYLAPEQRREDGAVGPEADVYALGVILYEMGSGGLPPGSRQRGASLAGAQQTSLMQMLPSWLQPFAQLLERMLEPDPTARPSMSHVAATLQQLSSLVPGGSASSLPPSSSTPKMPTALPSSAVSRPPLPSAVSRPPAPSSPLNEAATQPPASLPPPSPSLPASSTAETVPPAVSPSDEVTPTGPTRKRGKGGKSGKGGPRAPGSPTPPGTPVTKPTPPGPPKPLPTPPGPPKPPSTPPAPAPVPVKEPPPAEPGEGEVEMEADYTMSSSPKGKRGRAGDSLELGPTHLSDPELPASEASVETAVEPGVGNTVALKPGDLVGNFRITAKIGQGGMGAVYAAVHQQIGRRAAVKVLHGALGRTADYAQRFINEARAVNLLRHPSLVEIFDFGRLSDGTLYLIMEFLEGESLRALVRRKRVLGEEVAKDYSYQIAQAFALAHQKGIIHRDLKPENVMLVADPTRPEVLRVKVLDFGIAKVALPSPDSAEVGAAEGDFATAVGTTMGTPKYMAPEQYGSAAKVDGKADVFALGVMLYEMLSGQVPFLKTSLAAFHEKPKSLAEVAPHVSPKLAALVHRMLSPKPSERPTMSELLGELQPAQPVLTESVRAVPAPAPRSAWPKVAALFALLALGIAGFVLWRDLSKPSGPGEPVVDSNDLSLDVSGPRARALSVLYVGLRSPEPALRASAARALGQSRDATQWTSIASLLKDPDPFVQSEAAEALGQLGAVDAQGALTLLLESTQVAGVKIAAAAALARLQIPRGQKVLLDLLNSADERLKLRAAMVLLQSGDVTARPALWAAVNRGQLPEEQALRILGWLAQTGDPQATAQLQARLGGEDFSPRRISAAGNLARVGDERARAVLQQAAQKEGPQQLFASLMLATVGDTAGFTRFLAVALNPNQPEASRLLAVEGLAACGRRQGAIELVKVLDDPKAATGLRQAAAGAILQIAGGDPDQIAKQSLGWAQAALGNDSWLLRETATVVLADLENEQAVPLLSKALTDPQQQVRKSAATALGRKRLRAAVQALQGSLDDAEPEVRQAGLVALRRLVEGLYRTNPAAADENLVARLRQLAENGSPEDQVMAAGTLLQLGDATQRERLRTALSGQDPLLRKLVVETLPSGDGLLLEALSDQADTVRFAAAKRLAPQKVMASAEVLRQALSSGGADSVVAYGLLKKLGEKVSPPAGFGELLGRGDQPTSLALLDVIADLPVPEALQLLQKARLDSSAAVRRRVGEVAYDFYKAAPNDALLVMLYGLLNDPDIRVRTRVGMLVADLKAKRGATETPDLSAPEDLATPPDLAQADDGGSGGGTQTATRGFLRVSGEPGVRFQVDGHAPVVVASGMAPLSLSAGKHHVRFPGGTSEVEVPEGGTAELALPATLAEQLLVDAAAALGRRELQTAQTLLDRVKGMIARGKVPRPAQAEFVFLQARLHETGGRWLEAMTLFSQLLKDPARRPDHTQFALAAQARLRGRLGHLVIRKLDTEGTCREIEQWVRPGQHVLDQGAGPDRRPLPPRIERVREGETRVVDLCRPTP